MKEKNKIKFDVTSLKKCLMFTLGVIIILFCVSEPQANWITQDPQHGLAVIYDHCAGSTVYLGYIAVYSRALELSAAGMRCYESKATINR